MEAFQFKQFTIHQDQCAMKIGTDGVLLGAWTPINNSVKSILDIGAGTGVLALMMAQRCDSEIIDALEIDEAAYEQCVANFENSAWGDRLFCYHASFQEFVAEIDEQYDLLISNPPFYTENHVSDDHQRNLARFHDALPLEHLFAGATKLLSDQGKLAIILPYKEEERAIAIGRIQYLFPEKITRVKGNPNSPIKRSLLVFSKNEGTPEINELIIEITRHQYTQEYINLTKEFYLKM